MSAWVAGLLVYLFALFLATAFGEERSHGTLQALAAVLLALLILPPAATCAHALVALPPPPELEAEVSAMAEDARAPDQPAHIRSDVRGRGTAEFWLLFASLAAGGGATLTLVNNLSQLSRAMVCADAAPLVSLFAISSASGRLLIGLASAHSAAPRALLLLLGLVVLGTTLLGLSAASCGGLYLAVALAGHCFGSFWVLTPVIVAEQWGEKNAGSI